MARIRAVLAFLRDNDFALHAIAVAAAVAFALGFGWDYGVDNQAVYLLGSLRMVNPSVLAHDWFATETTHYHVAFRYLGALLLALSERGMGVAIAAHVTVTLGALSVYSLARSLLEKHAALAAYLAAMTFALLTRTRSAGATYMFDHILQPSTLASTGLLAGAAFFAHGRWFWSGVCVALGGLFHANILVLAYPACVFAQLVLGKRGLVARLALQMAPPTLVLLLLLPLIAKTALSPHAAEAQALWMNVRAPHHYLLPRFQDALVSLAMWHLLGFGGAALLGPTRAPALRRTLAFVAGLSAVIWICVALTTFFNLRQATQLMAWRIAPHVTMLLQLLLCAGGVALALEADAPRRAKPLGLALLVGGIGMLGLQYGLRKESDVPVAVAAVFGAGAAIRIVAQMRRVLPSRIAAFTRRVWPVAGGWAMSFAVLVLFWGYADAFIHDGMRRSTVLHGITRPEAELYRFMREQTPPDALFLAPPYVETLRYHGRRAIVADWKAVPIVPAETLAWRERLTDVVGRPIRGFSDVHNYDRLDARRMSELAAKYPFEFVIVRRGNEERLDSHPVVFRNSKYVVLDVRE